MKITHNNWCISSEAQVYFINSVHNFLIFMKIMESKRSSDSLVMDFLKIVHQDFFS